MIALKPPVPIYVTDVAREIKAIGSSIWLLEKSEYGFVLRCERGSIQFRIILPPLVGGSAKLVKEGRTSHFVVTSIDDLRHWLQSFQTQNG